MSKYNEYQDKTILVTGGAGCVGSNLTRRLYSTICLPLMNGMCQQMKM